MPTLFSDPAIASAEDKASDTATGWGAKVNRDNRAAGGYYWSTYKAICRRNGVYSNGQGEKARYGLEEHNGADISCRTSRPESSVVSLKFCMVAVICTTYGTL